MKALWVLAASLCVGGFVQARPVIIEESSTLTLPDPTYYLFGWHVALDGEFAVGIGYKTIPNENDPDYDATMRTGFLFRRVNGAWTYVRPLGSQVQYPGRDGAASHGVDMRHGVAVLSFGGSPLIYERVGNDFVQRPVANAGYDRGDDVYVDPILNRIILGGECWGATIVDKDPDGTWRGKGYLPGDYCGSTDGASGGPVALWGNQAVVSNPYNEDGLPGPAVTTFTTANGSNWVQEARIVMPEGHAAGQVAIGRPLPDGRDRMLVEDANRFGTAIYLRDAGDGQWVRSSTEFLRSSNDWMGWRDCVGCYPHGGSVEVGEGFLLRHAFDSDSGRRVVHVYTRYQNSAWIHAATLKASDESLTGRIAISGRNVLLGGSSKAYYFELPASFPQPTVLQDTFPGTTATGWTPQAGSTFAVVQGTGSRVYRQTNMAGEAGAVLNASSRIDQSIQADVKPTAVNGADRWVGLVTRRADAANYYYVTHRSSGIIALKRMYQGQFSTLDSASLPFTLNRNYRMRLESVGTTHRVYVDGVKILEANDEFLTQGRAGLLMYRAAADFDNVVVGPGFLTTIWQENGQGGGSPANPEPWTYFGGQWAWTNEGSTTIFRQTSLTDSARAFAGPVVLETDQAVEARARLRAFGTGTDPWFGVVSGARDQDTYTYLSLRRSNTVTLRKVVAGTITQLGVASYAVTPGTWYRLRLETIGNRVRGYVNGRLVVEATDNAPTAGQAGVVTYRTQADFDDFNAVVP
jgi:hypothetical protein